MSWKRVIQKGEILVRKITIYTGFFLLFLVGEGGGTLQLHKMLFLLFQDQKQVFAKQGFMLHRNKICFSHRKLCLKRIQLSLNIDFVFQNTLLLFLLFLLIFYVKKMQSFSHVSCFDKFQIWLLSNQM